jgi:hypothetical protein
MAASAIFCNHGAISRNQSAFLVITLTTVCCKPIKFEHMQQQIASKQNKNGGRATQSS